MSERAKQWLDQLLTLPEADRLLLADELWHSVSDGTHSTGVEELAADPEFQAEFERRLQSLNDGTAELLDGEQVFREARERLQARRKT